MRKQAHIRASSCTPTVGCTSAPAEELAAEEDDALEGGVEASPSENDSAQSGGRLRTDFSEEFSWGRSWRRYVGNGYIPPNLAGRLEGLELIEQLFVVRREMKLRIRYELGRATIRRPSGRRGLNKPITYASNIWNRGYANCAGHCVVFAAVLQMLGVPYCIVSVTSPKTGVPKHAILEVGFPESTDIKAVNCRAHELWEQYYGRKMVVRKDKETREAKWVKLFRGLKFTHSRAGSEAAKVKGVGRWLWMDPLVHIGYYLHLVEHGYINQDGKGFSFALPPEIKTWREVSSQEQDSAGGTSELEEEQEEEEQPKDDTIDANGKDEPLESIEMASGNAH